MAANATGRSSCDSANFRSVLGNFASGIVVITGRPSAGPVGMSCQAFFALSLEPPLVALATALTSKTWPRIAAAGEFCVNVLAAAQATLGQAFSVSGADKYAGVGWRASPLIAAPILDGALAWIECRVEQTQVAGDHHLVVARVLDGAASEGDPLIFFRSRYHTPDIGAGRCDDGGRDGFSRTVPQGSASTAAENADASMESSHEIRHVPGIR